MLWRLLDSWLAPAPDQARTAWLAEGVYAHRGLHGGGVPENSAPAFAAAIEGGFGIECDVRLSRDGCAIVFHDERLDRLTGASGALAERSASELTALTLGPAGGGPGICTLRDLLGQVAGQVPLLIELKSARRRPVAPLCRAVRAELTTYAGRHAVMSFDPRIAGWFARHSPGTVRGLIVTEENARTPGYPLGRHRIGRHFALWRARPDFLAYDIRDLPSAFAAAQRRRGLPVLTWTVNTSALRDSADHHADAPIAEGAGLAKAVRSASDVHLRGHDTS